MIASPDCYLLKHALAASVLMLLNYALWFSAAPMWANIMTIYALFAALAVFLLRGGVRRYGVIKLFILVLFALALGSPTEAWDARSIWLFHAKRILLDNSIIAQLDGYQAWMHVDYPVFVPALTASLAMAIGAWNELFPKASGIFTLLPALYVLASVLPRAREQWGLACVSLLVGGVFLINGYMDAILAFYITACALCLFLLQPRGRLLLALTALLCASLGILKNEGLIALVLFMAMLAYRKDFRGMGMVLIGVAPALWWRYLCVQHSIGNDMLTVNVPQTLLHNASEPKHYLMLLWYMFGRNAITLLLPLACYIVMLWKYRAGPSMLVISLFAGLYTGALIFAYFATPYDFLWHLYTSADRVMLPVGLMLGYFSIVILASALGSKIQSPTEEESPDP